MIDERDDSLYNDAYGAMYNVLRDIRLRTSKKDVWVKCKDILEKYRAELQEAKAEKVLKESEEKNKELHKYKVVFNYEDFPAYESIEQIGDLYIFYRSHGLHEIATCRHASQLENINHQISQHTEIVHAADRVKATEKAELGFKHHIVSMSVEKLPND